MSEIMIERTSPRDNQQRQLIVKLDDAPFATLMFGKKAVRKVDPGPHRLRVDNTWLWKNLDFEVADGEQVRFQLINRSGKFTWFLVSLLGAGPMYLTIERIPS